MLDQTMNHEIDNDAALAEALQQYERAVELQLQNQPEQAAALYEKVLERFPLHHGASHNLAMLYLAKGSGEAALELAINALEAQPGEAQYWVSLMEVLVHLGQREHAEGLIEQARQAGHGDTVLTRLRSILHPTLDLAEREALVASQKEFDLASLDERVQKVLEQEVRQARVGKKRPKLQKGPTPRQVAGALKLFDAKNFADLERYAEEMSRRHPMHPIGWHLLGVSRLMLCTHYYGVEALLRAVSLKPGDAEYLDHLASALRQLGRADLAGLCFARAYELNPKLAPMLIKYTQSEILRGNAELGGKLSAVLVRDFPQLADAHYLRATYLRRDGRLGEAEAQYQEAIRMNPRHASAYQDLGLMYFNQGRLAESIELSRQAVEHMPGNAACYSNVLFFASHDERISPEELFRMHREYARRYEDPLKSTWLPHENDRTPDRKLRVGFVSADFHGHAVASFITPILEHLDHERFDLFGFYNNTVADETTRRLEGLFKYWLPVSHVTDAALADIVRACKIDILVDLSGHTGGNRLLTFARKPAPIQVTWIGYPNTTGLKSIDYAFGDRHNAPAGLYDHTYTEKIVRLPSDSPFKFPDHAPDVGPLPALRNGYLTFGSFNRLGKISPVVLDMWARAMHACDGSRLLMGAVGSTEAKEKMVAEFAARGISSERLRFEPKKPANEYLALHNDIDIILDTFPYNGGTTSGLALWMGVPVLTMAGRTRMSNAGAGGMRRFGLERFVATDPEDFVQKAQQLSISLEELAGVRQGLRKRLIEAPDRSDAFITKGFERALRMMWQRWCSGLPAETFFVDS